MVNYAFGVLLTCAINLSLSSIIDNKSSSSSPGEGRVDCFPDPGSTQSACEARGCLWHYTPGNTINEPACYFAPGSGGYTVSGSITADPIVLSKTRGVSCPFGDDIASLNVRSVQTANALRVRITSPTQPNVMQPTQVLGMPSFEEDVKRNEDAATGLTFNPVTDGDGVFSFQVIREATGKTLWDTSIGPLFFTDQFIEISATLPSAYIYGIGEQNHDHFLRDTTKYARWPMWARDEPPNPSDPEKNLYGVHAVYLALEGDGNAHGVFLLNTHAQEIGLGPAPHLTYRAIGGDFDIYFMPGPTPEDVAKQYHSLIEANTMVPAYWSLGFQICRYGYKNLAEVKGVVDRMKAAGIPQDVQYIDIDYMDKRMDFTYDKTDFAGLPDFINSIHSDDYSMRFILILDPAIQVEYATFARGIAADVYINWPNSSTVPATNGKYPSSTGTRAMLGRVWPDLNTAFPDFWKPAARAWWAEEIRMLHDTLAFDGLWVDMNEPSCFNTNDQGGSVPNLICPSNKLENPAYKTAGIYHYGEPQMSTKTLCMVGTQIDDTHYRYHNLYGLQEAIATNLALKTVLNKRPVVITRSTFATSGAYAGHWLGDNNADWLSMRTSVVGILDMNLFGIAYTGADICGFNGNSNEELCLRWQQLGAFYTFSRNHNTINDNPQDPTQWPTVAAATKQANLFRYYYLPYLYTLFCLANQNGGTVLRPLLFNYPSDAQTYAVDTQFMWGDALLITPVLEQGANTVSGYLPDGVWYDIRGDGSRLAPGSQSFSAEWTELLPVQLSGGKIVPRQVPARTTKLARTNPMEVAIGVDSNGQATGQLIWDAGDSLITDWSAHDYWHLNFAYRQSGGSGALSVTTAKTSSTVSLPLFALIDVYGAFNDIDRNSVTLNGHSVTLNSTSTQYTSSSGRMTIGLAGGQHFGASTVTTIQWRFQ